MNLEKYLNMLCKEYNVSLPKLAEKIHVNYRNLLALKKGEIKFISQKILNKLSDFENRPAADILFDIFKMTEEYKLISDVVLKYLSKKYAESYSINLQCNLTSTLPLGTSFEGIVTRKGISHTFTVVDSWECLKYEHYLMYKTKIRGEYNAEWYSSIFNTEVEYYYSVLAYAEIKLSTVSNNQLRHYDILFSLDEANEKAYLENNLKISNFYGLNLEIIE